VTGSSFVSGSKVRWNGADRTTTYVSATQLTAAIPATDIATAGTPGVTVFNPAPGGGTSGAKTFTTNNPVAAITTLSPGSATAGGPAFTLAVTGTGFVSGSKVRWNGADRTTTFVSATQLNAAIPATDIASIGTAYVTVFNPTPGGGTSSQKAFSIIAANNPVPSITTLSPSSATAGGAAFTLTVTGTGFVSTSKVRWNGADRTTTYVSATQLTAAIPATDIAASGTASVTVFNPTPGGGISSAKTFTINPASTAPPKASFSGSPTSGKVILTVQFIDTSTGSPTSWTWDFGDGTTSTAKHPTHAYAKKGFYTVKLTVTNPGGSNTLTRTNYVRVK